MKTALLLHGFARPPWPLLFGMAAAGHVMAIFAPESAMLPLLCGSLSAAFAGSPLEMAGYILAFARPTSLALGWLAMLVVMMPPLLGWPLMHIWRSTLPAGRARTIALFLIAYAMLWLAAGLPLIAAALALRLVIGTGALAGIFLIAGSLLWSASPWQRAVLNRGHRLMRIGIRGWKADRDSLAFGLSHGSWCVLSCWPWMLAPMVSGAYHVPVMTIATLAMLVERLSPPGRPRWRLPATLALLASSLNPQPQSKVRYG